MRGLVKSRLLTRYFHAGLIPVGKVKQNPLSSLNLHQGAPVHSIFSMQLHGKKREGTASCPLSLDVGTWLSCVIMTRKIPFLYTLRK